jgi:hypothetical protein
MTRKDVPAESGRASGAPSSDHRTVSVGRWSRGWRWLSGSSTKARPNEIHDEAAVVMEATGRPTVEPASVPPAQAGGCREGEG